MRNKRVRERRREKKKKGKLSKFFYSVSMVGVQEPEN